MDNSRIQSDSTHSNDSSVRNELDSIDLVVNEWNRMTILGLPIRFSTASRVVHNHSLVETWIEVKNNVIWSMEVDGEASVVGVWDDDETEAGSVGEALNWDVHWGGWVEVLAAEVDSDSSSDHCWSGNGLLNEFWIFSSN